MSLTTKPTLEELQREFVEAFMKADTPAERLEIKNAYEMKFAGHGYQHLVYDTDGQIWKEKA